MNMDMIWERGMPLCFLWPENIGYLFLLIPLAVLFGFGVTRELHIRSVVVESPMADSMMPRLHLGRLILKKVLLFLGVAALLVALTGPCLFSGGRPVLRNGADLVFLLDVSRSMQAKDVLPDRLGQAKQEIIRISHAVRGGRRGTLLFAAAPLVQCPLTADQTTFDALIEMASPSLIEEQGTAFRPAFELASTLLQPASEAKGSSEIDGEKIAILLSDGEDHAGDLRAAAFNLKKNGIHLFVIGVGMDQPVVIPSESGSPKRDAGGRVVMSSFRSETLQSLARDAAGSYFRSRADHSVSGEISAKINRMAVVSRWVMEPAEREPVGHFFVMVALVLLVAESMIGKAVKMAG